MLDNSDVYNDRPNELAYFSLSERNGIVIAGDVAACISFIANSIVLILHGIMLCYKPVIVNRLSLRMIVFSCILNMVYCTCQLVINDIDSIAFSCRALAFVIIASDTMACMCLAMVGLNLVTIFVFKISRTFKLELVYYFFIIISGVTVVIIPLFFGVKRGPDNTNTNSCWYHFYFIGRKTKIFNWMWYYGWLLFSLVFAAFCASISIRFVMKRQDNFAGTLDMFTKRNNTERNQINSLKKYTNNNTDIFTKIAIRCICYPLVPLFSKSWGVGIEIAESQNAHIPYPIYILDRIFSCLLGLMVSCIYFTDPTIGAVLKEYRDSLKTKYVYDYYCVKYQPFDSKLQDKSNYPRLVNVVYKTESIPIQFVYSTDLHSKSLNSYRDSFVNPLDMSQLHPHMSRAPIYQTNTPHIEVYKSHKDPCHERRISVLSVTTMNGKVFSPNETLIEEPNPNHSLCFSSNVVTIPMQRIKKNTTATYTKSTTDTVETIVPFRYPKTAKMIHWTLVSVFKVNPFEKIENDKPDLLPKKKPRVFRDFTDHSNPSTPSESEDHFTTHNTSNLPQIIQNEDTGRNEGSKSMQNEGENIKEFPLRKVASINLATLFRRKFKNEFSSPKTTDSDPSTMSSRKNRLSKILHRGRSFSWNKLAHSRRKTDTSSLSAPVMIEMVDSIPAGGRIDSDIFSNHKHEDDDNSEGKEPSVFSGQLSPRPVPRPKKRARGKDKPVILKSNKTTVSDHHLFGLSLLFDNKRNMFEDEPTADDIIQPYNVTLTPTEDLRSVSLKSATSHIDIKGVVTKQVSIQSLDNHEEFIEGITTIDYISNWQEGDYIEENRLDVYSEPWDIQKQFQNQFELEHTISLL